MSSSLDQLLAEEVFDPWERSCNSAVHPWEATPELRQTWGKMLLSEDYGTSFCGALALARCASLSKEEKGATEFYFNNWQPGNIEPAVVSTALLSGASPPHIFIQSYLSYMLLNDKEEPGYWGLMSSYIRHPHCAVIPTNEMFPENAILKIKYLLNANPGRVLEFDGEGTWFEAQKIFRSRKPRAGASLTEISCLAKALRTDWRKDIFEGAIRGLMIEPIFAEDILDKHPCKDNGAIAPYSSVNPSLEAIHYFSREDPVSAIWRFHNPLLILPWLANPAPDLKNPLVYSGMLLCGMVPPDIDRIKPHPLVMRMMETHPLYISGRKKQ